MTFKTVSRSGGKNRKTRLKLVLDNKPKAPQRPFRDLSRFPLNYSAQRSK